MNDTIFLLQLLGCFKSNFTKNIIIECLCLTRDKELYLLTPFVCRCFLLICCYVRARLASHDLSSTNYTQKQGSMTNFLCILSIIIYKKKVLIAKKILGVVCRCSLLLNLKLYLKKQTMYSCSMNCIANNNDCIKMCFLDMLSNKSNFINKIYFKQKIKLKCLLQG